MLAIKLTMIRRVASSVLLLLFAGIYAIPFAAALSPAKTPECCAGRMCARPGHMAKAPAARQTMPDCPMHSQHHNAVADCEANACQMHNYNAISVGLFVFFAPAGIARAQIQTSAAVAAFTPARLISQLPETPPPRILPA
jgi:hypothetical protein